MPKVDPDGMPPTPEDRKLRVKHVLESVHYNIHGHAKDHISGSIDQLKKLKMVDPKLAKKTAHDAALKVHLEEAKLRSFK
jgi:hypothetical protein